MHERLEWILLIERSTYIERTSCTSNRFAKSQCNDPNPNTTSPIQKVQQSHTDHLVWIEEELEGGHKYLIHMPQEPSTSHSFSLVLAIFSR